MQAALSTSLSRPSNTWYSRKLWLILLVLSLIAAVVAFQLMFNALPALKANITFTRGQAIVSADRLQQKLFPELKTNRLAVSFATDRNLQTYVELEGGGIHVFNQQINNPDFAPYAWNVRRFAESQEQEFSASYSPNGSPLAFSLNVPEKEPGAALEVDAARAIAEAGIGDFWGERFLAYKIFDTKLIRQTSGRIDHIFTYEQQSLRLGEATFRVELVVAGDRLVAIRPYNHIPDAFNQRFNEMRATNNNISQIANYLMMGLLGLGGLLGGGLWLHKRHQLQWLRALIPAAVVASGLAASMLCNLPITWMGYATTVSVNNFLFQQIVGAGVVLISSTLIFATIYAVAEGLSRMAFADQLRLFDFFRLPVASSNQAFGRVLGGYIWVGFFLLYAMLFILVTHNGLGWWSPADLEVDPNILASWRPALGPIFTALQAGTWEECVFRAIPLAAAALIGTRFGIRKPLLIFTLFAQALIFGGAHANYPNLPGYSRLIELFIPAMAFGLVYLRFGLIPGILAHFVYDLVLMSMPIFVAADSQLLVDKGLVMLAGSAPLIILLWARYRIGAHTILSDEWRNGAEIAEIKNHDVVLTTSLLENAPVQERLPAFRVSARWLLPLGIFNVVILLAALVKTPDIEWPHFQVNRAEALQLAQAELSKHGVTLSGEWHSTVLIRPGWGQQRDFVWRESDKKTFQSLLGRFLDTPYWEVTWRKFDGPVEQRTEQWIIFLRPDGSLQDLMHDLPEAAVGAKLTREQATTRAKQWIVEHQWAEANQLEEKSVEEIVRPNRSDWRVTFIDRTAFDQSNGQASIKIIFNGDAITASFRSIDIPNEWQRAEAEQQAKKAPFSMAGGIALVMLIGLVLSTFVRKHQGRAFNLRITLPWLAIIVGAMLIDAVLWLDTSAIAFQPSMSWSTQLWTAILWKALLAVAVGIISALMLQAIYAERPAIGSSAKGDFLLGMSLALALAAFNELIILVFPSHATPQPNTADLASYIPWLSTIINGIKTYVRIIAVIILAMGIVRFNQSHIRLALLAVLALVWWLGSGFAAFEVGFTLVSQAITLLSIIIIVVLVSRQQTGAAIAMAGVDIALHRMEIANALYSPAWIHASIAALVALVITYGLVWHWHRNKV